MISKDSLELNLNELRKIIPHKPKVYTKDHPIKIKEALEKYSNQRTVDSIQVSTTYLNNEKWPLILWFDPHNIKVGFLNELYYKKVYKSSFNKKFKCFKDFDLLSVIIMNNIYFKIPLSQSISEAFDANIKYIEQQLLTNEIIQSKEKLIKEIFIAFKKEHWSSCIISIFPILDYVARKLLKTKNLGTDISKICKLFEQNGFSLTTVDYLMPGSILTLTEKHDNLKERLEIFDIQKKNSFGIIGPALSSFLRFANYYYGYYKEDNEETNILNRHAIMHGAINDFGNKENTLKLITFLYLFLELKPVFEILFKE